MRSPVLLALAALLPPTASYAQAPTAIDTAAARRIVAEAATLTARDGGRLWGRSLDGPLLFVHPATRALLAAEADSSGALRADAGWWRGVLPMSEPAANTASRWGGRTWAMLLWPLGGDSLSRQVLLGHELWHRIQGGLGFDAATPGNAHLATAEGRLWLRLEGRALAAALEADGPARQRALGDAALFRRARHHALAGAREGERALELNEGLAEYTGVTMAGEHPADRRALIARRLASLDSAPHFERDFAYHTGPAWGYFLDLVAPDWRTRLTASDDLAALVERALTRRPVAVRTAATRGAGYGYAAVRKAEAARAAARRKHEAELTTRFVAGAVLTLPLREMKMSFDPGQVEAFDTLGSVYGMLRLSDRWGVLQVDGSGGLIAGDFRRAVVPAPADTVGRRLTGPGWVLELLPGWRLVPGPRPGDWTLVESP